eukprot:TRINITY_DN769_c1_g1_i3.p1 TRINITY_DN769_c1_g1~~TRINITY_DN769_c1_g1_i3.p1  ORF type:complete len:102 (+),score=12.24 TRINITY_DN769_c1_g1_i3:46-351(+)
MKLICHLFAIHRLTYVATVITLPLDVVKTRIQTQISDPDRLYLGIRQTFTTMVRNEGPKSLFRGLGPRLVTTIPSAGITFAAYEAYKKFFMSLNLWETPSK